MMKYQRLPYIVSAGSGFVFSPFTPRLGIFTPVNIPPDAERGKQACSWAAQIRMANRPLKLPSILVNALDKIGTKTCCDFKIHI